MPVGGEDAPRRRFRAPGASWRTDRRSTDRRSTLTSLYAYGAVYLLVYLPLLAWLYGRQRRWHGMAGWAFLVGGILLAFGGAGDAFAWAGLLWSAVAMFGLLLIATDIYNARWRDT